jgi:hypothetical protein
MGLTAFHVPVIEIANMVVLHVRHSNNFIYQLLTISVLRTYRNRNVVAPEFEKYG